MALKIKPTSPGGASGLFKVIASDPQGTTGTNVPGQETVNGSYDYETRTIAGTTHTSGAEAADYPYPVIASITSPSAAGSYSTVNLYPAPNNPVSMYPSSSYRRRIQSNHGNVGIRG